MSKKRAVLAAALVIGSIFLFAAFTTLHKAKSEMQGDSHFAKSTRGEALPETWSKLGVQLVYSSSGSKEGHDFLQQLARELRRKGIAQVGVLPGKVDLTAAGEELEGLLLVSLNKLEVAGWQLNRRGKVTVNFHFVPLKATVIDSIRGGAAAAGTATGWVNKAVFTGQLQKFTAGKTAEKVIEALNPKIKTHTEGAGYPIKGNVESLPATVTGFVPSAASTISYIAWKNSFTLSYITEEGNLESFLSEQLKSGLNLDLAYDWVDSEGARRRAEYFDAGNGQVVEAFYVYLDDLAGGSMPGSPRREPSGPKLVTIIKRPDPASY
jgi:hypothetical protein